METHLFTYTNSFGIQKVKLFSSLCQFFLNHLILLLEIELCLVNLRVLCV